MLRNMQVNRLGQDEITYELRIREIATRTVENMRHNLAMALRLETSGESIRNAEYPFKPDKDLLAVKNKLDMLKGAIVRFRIRLQVEVL